MGPPERSPSRRVRQAQALSFYQLPNHTHLVACEQFGDRCLRRIAGVAL